MVVSNFEYYLWGGMSRIKKDVVWRKRKVDERLSEIIAKELGISGLMSKILVGRGQDTLVKAERFLNPRIEDAESPFVFSQMKKAAERLKEAVLNGEKIGVFSDADADGVSAAAIIYNFLVDCRVPEENILVKVPSRDREGYGLTVDFVQEASKKGVKLIITADCGIRNHFEISFARSLGIDTIVCDHHQMDFSVPQDAYAVIHPKMLDVESTLSFLSGAGVAFELIAGTRYLLKKMGFETSRPRNYLDVLSIGTIGDMVPLLGDNRIFVSYGLKLLSQRGGNMGLQALVERANLRGVSSYDLQMKIIPRINSSGRAGRPEISFYLLTERNPKRIAEISEDIESANIWRKEKVQAIIEEIELLGLEREDRYSVVAYGEDWPEGVLGLVASRILERSGKPTCVISIRKNEARGSIRSPDFLNIMGVLEKLSPMMRKYGGHAQAAGVSLDPERVQEFCAAFESEIRRSVQFLPSVILEYDEELYLEDCDIRTLTELMRLEPFGEGNPYPSFLIRCEIVESRVVGDGHLRLYAKIRGGKIPMIAFEGARKVTPFVGDAIVVAKLRPSQTEGVEFEIVDFLKAV